MLTDSQRQTFDQLGFVHLENAFAQSDALVMENLLWRALGERFGATPDDPETWDIAHVSGLQALKSDPVFDAIGTPAVIAAIDDLLGENQWVKPSQWGQFLVNFPVPGPWNVPIGWHTDFEYDVPFEPLPGLVIFMFLADVKPDSGGTALLIRSHRAVARFLGERTPKARAKMKTVRKAFLDSDPWLRELDANTESPHRIQRYVETQHEVADTRLQVVQLSGHAGDVVLTHPWLLHAPAPNCGKYPRFMRVQRIRRQTPA